MSINISTYNSNNRKEKTNLGINEFLDYELSKKFSDKNKVSFYKEFASLLQAGVDFKKALEILKEQQSKKELKKIIEDITVDVIRGKALHESLKDTGRFSPYEYFSVKIGEETRRLEDVLQDLSSFFERKVKMKRQVISVITYPVFVLFLTFGVLYFMMNYVVPMFSSVFKQFGKELPSLTKKIVYISEHFSTISLILFSIIVLLILGHFYFRKKDTYRKYISFFLLKIPMIGKLSHKLYLARFCQALSLLLNAKTPLITAIELVQKMISFYPIEQSLKTVKEEVKKGGLLSESLSKHKIYDAKLVSMVSVAEQINDLDNMFEKLAQQYNDETEHQTKMIGVLIEPLIIIIIGFIVGIVLIAMYSPMFDLSKILQS